MIKYLFSVCCLVALLNQASAQKHALEFTGGLGNYQSILFLNNNNFRYYQGNIRFHRNTPDNKSILSSIYTGLLIERRMDSHMEADYLGIPVGVTGTLGERKIHFELHLGVQPCYLLSNREIKKYHNIQNIEKFLLGVQTGAGFGFKFSPNAVLNLQFQYIKDLTTRYLIEDGGRGPGTSYTELKGHAKMISIGIKTRLHNKI